MPSKAQHSKTEIHALIEKYFQPKHFHIFDNLFNRGAGTSIVYAHMMYTLDGRD